MTLRFRPKTRLYVEVLIAALAATVLGTVVVSWTVDAFRGDVNPDAGYYVSLARLVRRGLIPYIDFPSVYAPGAYYLLALAGDSALTNLPLLRSLFFAIHIANALLLLALLRVLRVETLHSVFWFTIFLLWTHASRGAAIVLEPFELTFLLAGVLALLNLPGLRGPILGGLALGCAMLVKQYALLLLPGYLVLALHARASQKWWMPLTVMTVSAAVPYLLFALVTGQSLPENLLHIATFGGRAVSPAAPGGLYEANGLMAALGSISEKQVFALILPALTAAVVAILLDKSVTTIGLTLCFVGSLAPTIVRPYTYYLHIAIPWGVLIFALLAHSLSRVVKTAAPELRLDGIFVIIVAMPFAGLLTSDAYNARATYFESKFLAQKRIAASVRRILPNSQDVVVINGQWLYLLADLVPPRHEFRFVASADDELLDDASYVVVFPEWGFSFDEAIAMLEATNFKVIAQLAWHEKPVVVLRRTRES